MVAEADGWSLGLSLLFRCLEIRELRTWRSSEQGYKQHHTAAANFFSGQASWPGKIGDFGRRPKEGEAEYLRSADVDTTPSGDGEEAGEMNECVLRVRGGGLAGDWVQLACTGDTHLVCHEMTAPSSCLFPLWLIGWCR
jgi:hypothetical protein